MASVLMEPFRLGNLRLRNRIVMLPMGTGYADSRGFVTQRMVDHYTERARGGAGLIVVECTCVALGGKNITNELSIYDDRFILGLKGLAKAIKEAGSYCFIQLAHSGRRALSAMNDGVSPVGPSAIPMWRVGILGGELPRALSIEGINELIEAYANAAGRGKEAGFDGVELHYDHGYLITQFFSPLTNKRTDKYGGSLEARARFGVEIVQAVRRKVGESYPISIRFCGEEFILGGLTLTETRKIARMLEQVGATCFDVSASYAASSEEGYLNASFPTGHPSMARPRGHFVHLAKEIKEVVKVPVIAAGRLDDFKLANRVITEGKADLVGIGRGLIADPLLPVKYANRQFEDVRKCIACNTCSTTLHAESNVRCAVNADAGKEEEYRIRLAAKVKKVLVVGGGPGGMEAARVARLRGHDVTLVERKSYLGGNLLAASKLSFKKDIWSVADYLSTQISKQGVKVLLNTEADEQLVRKTKPDVVILAAGGSALRPAIPGIERENVTDVIDVLEEKTKVGHRVVVVGGGMAGCEAAVFLAEKGNEVTLVSRRNSDFTNADGLAPDMERDLRRWFLFEFWPKLPIEVIAKVTFREVTERGLIVLDGENKERLIGGDTIVFAVGMRPNDELKARLEGKVPEIYQVGDCLQPRKIIDAIHEASHVARLI